MDGALRIFLIYILGAPLIGISISYLAQHIDVFTLMGARYTVASMILIPYCLLFLRRKFLRALRDKQFLLILTLMSIIQYVAVLCWTLSLKHASETTYQIVNLFGIPLAITMSAFFFISERKIASNRTFQIGALIACIGTSLSIFAASTESASMSLGTIYAVIGVLLFCCNALLIRSFSGKVNPAIVATALTATTATLHGITACIYEAPITTFMNSGWGVIALLVISGIYGNTFFAFIEIPLIHKHGIAVQKILNLTLPLSAAILEYLILGKHVAMSQVWPALLIITGAYFSISSIYNLQLGAQFYRLYSSCYRLGYALITPLLPDPKNS